MRDDTILLNIK